MKPKIMIDFGELTMNFLTLLIGLPLLMVMTLGGCQSTGPRDQVDHDSATGLTSLENSLAPLRDHFNARVARPRFLAILSPT